jgi:uncharacterized protein with PQ loop repeat
MGEVFGWISAISFAVCGIPQAVKCYRDGHSEGISHGLLILWMLGEVTGIGYAISLTSFPLFVNYLFNGIFVSIMLRYKYWPRSE